jgi:hypothetical protein
MPANTFTLSETQQVVLSLSFLDADGNPGLITGNPSWGADTNVPASLTPAANGLTATLVGQAVGTVNITATAQSSSGAQLSATLQVSVIGGAAVSMSIVPGTPTNNPPAS